MPDASNDVFLSYSHRDNEAFGVEQRRWVSDFRKDLAVRLGVYLGREANVWMDPRQPGEKDFANDITTQLNATALLVAILSPSYLQSQWCCKELTEFAATAAARGGLFVQNACRVLKVFKLPVAREKVSKIDPQLDLPLGFKFFVRDSETDVARELSIHENPQIRKLYDPRVDDVALAAFRVLSGMGIAERMPKAAEKGSVYLAETTEDLDDQSLKLRRELEARGYDVLPRYQLPVRGSKTAKVIREGLKSARCSIHLFGARTGWIPEGESRSVIRLQHELAAQRDGDDFKRFLWIPPGLMPAEEAQGVFLQTLRQNPGSRKDYELAEVPFEELKAIVLETLSGNGHSPAVTASPRRVYLMSDDADDSAAGELAARLMDAGVDVDVPLRSANPAVAAQDHLETLRRADVVAIYWSGCDLGWVRQQHRAVRDFREAAPPGPTAVLLVTGPDSAEKRGFRARDLNVVTMPESGEVQLLVQLIASAPLRRGAPR